MNLESVHRLAAFTDRPEGGNPAGVWIGERFPPAGDMQRVAAEVGFSETAFLSPGSGFHRTVRYYSPEAQVPFCGHATIAAGVVLGNTDGAGTYRLEVVYYSGSRPVRGKFILMRNAGGPEETRKEIPFSLKSANSDKRVPVTVFKISR